jgi:hypothetical protein
VEGKNHLGIYLGRETATVVCMSAGGSGSVLDSFTVTTESQGQESRPGIKQLAHLVAQSCAARQLNFSGVAIALDCSMFMQHNIHSAFTEANQIASTVRFDTEEALATDITNLAITFKITSSDKAGSELVAFTCSIYLPEYAPGRRFQQPVCCFFQAEGIFYRSFQLRQTELYSNFSFGSHSKPQ